MPAVLVATGPSRGGPQWKPDPPLSLFPYADGPFPPPPSSSSFSHDTRLPLVSSSLDSSLSSPLLPRPFLSGAAAPERRNRRMKEEDCAASSVASSTCVAGEERRKRFPILGPTRQQTEMYFRNRCPRQRSVADRVKAEAKRQLVTRSADRLILPESTPTPRHKARPSSGVTPTSTILITTTPRAVNNVSPSTATPNTDATLTTTKMVSITVGRNQAFSKDGEEAVNGTSLCQKMPAAPGTGSDRSAASGCLPGAEPHQGSLQSIATSSPALVRLENSPEQSCASLPVPGFQHLRDSSTGGCTQRGRKKAEMSNLCEHGQQQPSHVARVRRREQTQKTMQPSKHGFHLRSKSPTFKRLVAATEKLQDSVTWPGKSFPRADRFGLRAAAGKASPGGIILPAVAGVWDGEAVEERGEEEEEEESDEDVTYLHPHPFLSSLPHTAYRSKLKSAGGGGDGSRHRLTRSVGTSMSSNNPKHLENFRGPDPSLIHGLGAWEVDSLGMEGYGDPVIVPVASLTSSSKHTELHLFLPRLADTLSEDGSSKLSPDHLGSRPAENRTANDIQRGKTMPHILPSQQPPQRSHTHCQQPADRSGRPQQDRKFTSPLRVVRRDRTPNNRRQVMATPLVESYASYEPYLKGEHLKEKLEDLPTLISLDQE